MMENLTQLFMAAKCRIEQVDVIRIARIELCAVVIGKLVVFAATNVIYHES